MLSALTFNRSLRVCLLLSGICLVLRLGLDAAWAQAGAPFSVRTAYLELVDGVYLLTARLHLPVDQRLREVVKDGVALQLELQIKVTRARNYWLDEDVAALVQQYELQYHAVSQRYVVRNVNSGEQTTFPNIDTAIKQLMHIVNLPVLDRALVAKDRRYEVSVRAVTNVGGTPSALRWIMFWANDWNRASEWYTWPLPQ